MASHRLSDRQKRARILAVTRAEAAALGREPARDLRCARRLVGLFNAALATGRVPLFAPTIGAALLCGHHWLHLQCDGCDTVKAVDLRVVPRDLGLPVTALLPKLACTVCRRAGVSPLLAPRIYMLSSQHG